MDRNCRYQGWQKWHFGRNKEIYIVIDMENIYFFDNMVLYSNIDKS